MESLKISAFATLSLLFGSYQVGERLQSPVVGETPTNSTSVELSRAAFSQTRGTLKAMTDPQSTIKLKEKTLRLARIKKSISTYLFSRVPSAKETISVRVSEEGIFGSYMNDSPVPEMFRKQGFDRRLIVKLRWADLTSLTGTRIRKAQGGRLVPGDFVHYSLESAEGSKVYGREAMEESWGRYQGGGTMPYKEYLVFQEDLRKTVAEDDGRLEVKYTEN